MLLVHFGVPWQEAWSMSHDIRFAALIVLNRFKGGKWNWREMRWEEPKE